MISLLVVVLFAAPLPLPACEAPPCLTWAERLAEGLEGLREFQEAFFSRRKPSTSRCVLRLVEGERVSWGVSCGPRGAREAKDE